MLAILYALSNFYSDLFGDSDLARSHELNALPHTPQSTKELIDAEKLESLIEASALEGWSQKLYEAADASTPLVGHPTRAIGTPGHNASLDLILGTLRELEDFYTFDMQPFFATEYTLHGFETRNANGAIVESQPLYMSPPGNVTNAPVAFVEDFGCLPSDYNDVEGCVAIVKRGKCPFGEKSEIAGLSGVLALLIYDPELPSSAEVFSGGTLLSPLLGHEVSTLGISANAALTFEAGQTLSVFVNSTINTIETINIIAESIDGDHDNVVFAGSHSDSVFEGPGMNDNGSGMLSLLEVARQLTNFKLKNAVRFAWWSAEEEGLVGSLWYAENLTKEQASKIRLFLDFDMMASTNYVYEIYDSDDSENPTGSSALRDHFVDWFTDHGLNYSLQPFDGRSDYVGFINVGIPSTGIDSGVEVIKTEEDVLRFGGEAGVAYDACYHQACDNLDNLNIEPWLVNTQAIAHAVGFYARSLHGFPQPDVTYYQSREPVPKRWGKLLV